MSCIFCKIINKEIPSEIIYEDDNCLAVLDVNPISPGHTMILPKVHSEDIIDLPEDKLEPFFSAAKKVAKKLKKSLNPDGFTMGINHGKASGQAIDHLHFHIIPRWSDDGGTSLHGVVSNRPEEPLKEIANKIRKA